MPGKYATTTEVSSDRTPLEWRPLADGEERLYRGNVEVGGVRPHGNRWEGR